VLRIVLIPATVYKSRIDENSGSGRFEVFMERYVLACPKSVSSVAPVFSQDEVILFIDGKTTKRGINSNPRGIPRDKLLTPINGFLARMYRVEPLAQQALFMPPTVIWRPSRMPKSKYIVVRSRLICRAYNPNLHEPSRMRPPSEFNSEFTPSKSATTIH